MDLAVVDLGDDGHDEWAKPEGVMVCCRLQLMLYTIMYRMMFDAWFESTRDLCSKMYRCTSSWIMVHLMKNMHIRYISYLMNNN